MSKNTSVSLGEHFSHFIDEQVGTGRFGSASDVVRAGLRLLEEREAKLSALQAALLEGERSGPAKSFNIETYLAKKTGKKNRRRAAAK